MLRGIPALVTEVGSDPTRIYTCPDSYPKNISLTHVLCQMASPSIMAVSFDRQGRAGLQNSAQYHSAIWPAKNRV